MGIFVIFFKFNHYIVAFAVVRIAPMRFVERRNLLNIIAVSYCRAGRGKNNAFHTK